MVFHPDVAQLVDHHKSTAASGAFARKQEKHRLFFSLQLPYWVRAAVIFTPAGVRPMRWLQ